MIDNMLPSSMKECFGISAFAQNQAAHTSYVNGWTKLNREREGGLLAPEPFETRTLRGTPYLVPRLVNFILDLSVNIPAERDLFSKRTKSLYLVCLFSGNLLDLCHSFHRMSSDGKVPMVSNMCIINLQLTHNT